MSIVWIGVAAGLAGSGLSVLAGAELTSVVLAYVVAGNLTIFLLLSYILLKDM